MPKPTLSRPVAGNIFFSSPKTHIDFVRSGCALFDCVLGGGWPLGRMVNLVGDKSTGKTLLAIEALANFQLQYPHGHSFYNETEAAFDDPYAEALGLDMSSIERGQSDTVEEMYDSILAFIKRTKGEVGIYILDSLDALSDKAEMGRSMEDGTYAMTKQKQLGVLFRRLIKPLEKSKVLFLIISQVRDAIGVTFGNKHTRSGGRALDFYASQIVWLANTGQNKKTINKIQRTIGVSIKAKTTKNKIGQPFRECEFDILFGYGVDDISTSLTFLKDAGEFKRVGLGESDQAIAAFKRQFQAAGNEEQAEMRAELDKHVRDVWYEVEATFTPRRGKYATA